jgi:flagellar hook-length control protein FliK
MPAVVLETSLTGSVVPLVQTASKNSPATGAAADQNRETALNPAAINGESLPQPSINAQNKGQMPLSGIEFNQAVAADSENRVKKAFTVDEMVRLAGEKSGENNKNAKATEPDSPVKVEQLKPGLGTKFDCAIDNSPHPNAVPDKNMLSNANFAESSKNAALPDLKDRLVQEIRSVLAAGRGEQQSRVQLKLSPEHLGQLTIQLFFNGDELSAHFYTGNNHVKEILEGSLQQLRDSLNQHELKLNEALVFAGDGGRGGDMGRSFEERNRPAWSANNGYYNHTYADAQVEPVDLLAITTDSSRVNYLI